MRRVCNLINVLAVCAGLFTATSQAQAPVHAERKVVSKVAPVYPELARRIRVTGVVKLEVVIRQDGSVKSVNVVGGHPVLISSATEAVRQWKFEGANEETIEVVQVTFGPR